VAGKLDRANGKDEYTYGHLRDCTRISATDMFMAQARGEFFSRTGGRAIDAPVSTNIHTDLLGTYVFHFVASRLAPTYSHQDYPHRGRLEYRNTFPAPHSYSSHPGTAPRFFPNRTGSSR
jgi:hypothetical protein